MYKVVSPVSVSILQYKQYIRHFYSHFRNLLYRKLRIPSSSRNTNIFLELCRWSWFWPRTFRSRWICTTSRNTTKNQILMNQGLGGLGGFSASGFSTSGFVSDGSTWVLRPLNTIRDSLASVEGLVEGLAEDSAAAVLEAASEVW